MKPPMNPESYEAADAASIVALSTFNLIKDNGPEGGNIDEAENLARMPIRIMKELSNEVIWGYGALAEILIMKKDFTDEKKSLYEEFLSDGIRCHGIDGLSTVFANLRIGVFHYLIVNTLDCSETKIEHLRLAEYHVKETVRIFTIHHGVDHSMCMGYMEQLSGIENHVAGSIVLGKNSLEER
jgi:hypothetical protein